MPTCKSIIHQFNLPCRIYLESCGTPVNKLNAPLALDGGDGSVNILGHDVAAVEHAAGHVLAMPWVALHHRVGRLEASVGDLSHAQRLVVSLLRRDDRGVGDQGEMNPEQNYLFTDQHRIQPTLGMGPN